MRFCWAFSPGRPVPGAGRHRPRTNFSAGGSSPVSLGPGPGLPRRFQRSRLRSIVARRRRRVQLVVDDYGRQCLLLGFLPHPTRSSAPRSPCVRSSVALPPGIGVPLAPQPGLPGEKNQRKNQQNTQRVRAAPRAAGGARSEIAVFEQQSGSSGGVSRHREIPAELRAENIFRHESRCFASPASAVPLGTPTGPAGQESRKGLSPP